MKQMTAIGAAVALYLTGCNKHQEPKSDDSQAPSMPKPELIGKPNGPQFIEHKILRGETLGAIGKKYGTTAEVLAEVNAIKDPSLIQVGGIIKIPVLHNQEGPAVHPRNDSQPNVTTQETFERVSKGGDVPFLHTKYMPKEVTQHLKVMNEKVRAYALKKELPLTGPAECGRGVCSAFEAVQNDLRSGSSTLTPNQFDRVFANPRYYLAEYGSQSRDAYKIEETLRKLSSMPESGWVRFAINDYPKVKGLIDRHHVEGKLYHPGNLPSGIVLCYSPNPEHKAYGYGAIAWGHIEFKTEDERGTPWYVFTVNSTVHGGSVHGRQTFNDMRAGKGITCSAFLLTTPECKAKWLAAQSAAARRGDTPRNSSNVAEN